MKALALGGDGFLGSHVVDRLVAEGHDVTVFDRFPAGKARHLGMHGERVRLIRGEFGATPELREALAGQDVVYHFISATTPGSSWGNPEAEIDGNITPTLEFLKFAAEAGVARIAFASSGGTVYGRRDGILTEDTAPMPESPYGIGKLAIEGFIRHACQVSGANYDIYRIANAYGPRQPESGGQGVIAIWIARILNGNPIDAFGIDTIRDYVFVEDIAHLMTLSARRRSGSGLFNIGTGKGTSLARLIELFREMIPVPFDVSISPGRPFDVPSIVLSGDKILNQFPGFQYMGLEDGIQRTWAEAVARSGR